MCDWDKLFSYDRVTIFICVYLILASGVLFLHERTSGTLPIVRMTRRGRAVTAAAKMISTLLLDVIASVIFSLGVLVTCAFSFGLSDASLPIQSIITHASCPYTVSIAQYALMMLGVRAVAAVMFAAVVALASSLSFSPVVTYVTGAVFMLANVIVNFFITSSDWLLVNLISVMTANGPLQKYTEVISFGHYRSTVSTFLVIYAAIAIASSVAAILCGGRRSAIPAASGRLGALSHKIASKLSSLAPKKKARRRYPSTVFAWECGKLLTPAIILTVVILLILSARDANNYYNARISEGELRYETYVNEHLYGPATDEKQSYIYERMSYTSEMTSEARFHEMLENSAGDELYTFLDERNEAMAEAAMLGMASEKMRYLQSLEDDIGERGWFIFDVKLDRILSRDINIYMLAAVIIVFSRMYGADYAGKVSEGNFAAILRTTRRGRRSTYRAKMLSALAVSLLTAAAFIAVDVSFGIASTDRFFDLLSAPLLSVAKYAGMHSDITVGAYLMLVVAARAAACIIIAYLTCAASFALHRLPSTLFAVSLFTLLPYALVYMGVLALRYVDITAMFAGGKLFTRSAELAVGGSPFAFAAMLVCGYTAVTAAASLAVRAKVGE